jgi:hypothetical protein
LFPQIKNQNNNKNNKSFFFHRFLFGD